MNDYGQFDGRGSGGDDRDDSRGGREMVREMARQKVALPALLLTIYGVAAVFLAVLALGVYGARPELVAKPIHDFLTEMAKEQAKQGQKAEPIPRLDEYTKQIQTQGVIGAGIGLVGSIITLLGAMKMRSLEGYGLAMAGTIVAIIPCTTTCCFVGTPLGIWAIIVLLNADVKYAFSIPPTQPSE